MAKPKDISAELYAFDEEFFISHGTVAGMDEAGRGPLAGPVVAACVVMPRDGLIPYVNDSKKLSEKRRREVYAQICERAICLSTGIIPSETIDEINILNATKLAMTEALKGISPVPDILLIDAVKLDVDIAQENIVKGDAKSYAIACASIVAKTVRDDIMIDYDSQFPGYGFAKHKGYGTKAHYEAIREHGFCPIHRRSFLKVIH